MFYAWMGQVYVVYIIPILIGIILYLPILALYKVYGYNHHSNVYHNIYESNNIDIASLLLQIEKVIPFL